jgi:hypothetical protein
LKPSKGDCKNHYLIEVKRYKIDDEGIYIKAIEGISQMFSKKYYRHELLSKETTGIIMIGLAAHYDKICLISQKITVDNNVIVDLGTIRIQKFWINDKSRDGIKVDYEKPIERKIRKPSFKKDPKQGEIKEDYNKRMNKEFGDHMARQYTNWIKKLKNSTNSNTK